ncbi:MAG TPA: 3-hydroxyacyl-CoA dehydrogenase [bacterium]|nr:3-hydroxyacyl-CoA dehydrogenase [bacterium]
MQIKDTAALITGGASGLGAATARELHSKGGRVMLVDVAQDKGEALAKEFGSGVAFCKADVTSPDDMQRAVSKAVETFGGLQFAVCCAGIGGARRVVSKEGPMPLEHFNRIIQVNLIGTFNTVRLAAEAMTRNTPNGDGERGVVVMTASVAAFEGQIGQSPYSASKGGIVGMTLPLARDLSSLGIRVMTIAPGLFDTPLLGMLPEEARISLGKQVPFPSRLGQPVEYGRLVASIIEIPMLNGETIRLDGAIRMAPR